MPTTNTFTDTETTYELKTYQLTLSCGKCFKQGQLIATDRLTNEDELIHVCDKCGREQASPAPGYPRQETRKTLLPQRFIERVEIIPDKYTPEYYKAKDEVSGMSWDKKLELLRTTQDVDMIEYLQYATSGELRIHDAFRQELYLMLSQAATIREQTLPLDPDDKILEPGQVYDLANARIARLGSITRYQQTVKEFRGASEHVLIYNPEYCTVLYDAARLVVAHRGQKTPSPPAPATAQPAKNKGGRPRKVVTA